MKRDFWSLGLAAAVLLAAVAPTVYGQDALPLYTAYHKTIPLHGTTLARVRKAISAAAVAPSTVPMWNYTITSPLDGVTYPGTMIGANPSFNGARTTNIPTVIIPLIVKMPDGSTFDPTAPDRCSTWGTPIAQVFASPLFQSAPYTMNGINMGSGQYVDEFQRANFYNTDVSVTGDSYHTVLSPVTVLPAQTISIPANEGATGFYGSCAPIGIMDFSTFDSIIRSTVLPSLASQGVGPTTFPLFVLHDVVMADPGDSIASNCCVIGYHGAFGFPVQTYAVADYDTSRTFQNPDIQPMSNEVGEWMDDPFGTNLTPSWGHVGQVIQCQNNLEVGDPLSGALPTLYSQSGNFGVRMPSGQTYYPQALAFASWFYRQTPSLGAAGLYSNVGSTGFEKTICQ